MQAVVEEAGSSMDRVVKVTVLLRDMDEYANVNAVYSKCAWPRRGLQAAQLTRGPAAQSSPPTPRPRALPTKWCGSRPTVGAAGGRKGQRGGGGESGRARSPQANTAPTAAEVEMEAIAAM